MRCLHCGKELALLKRWTGGGEFCSDAHRQQYQEEYNKLALTRLLQARESERAAPDPQPEAKPAPAAKASVTEPAAVPASARRALEAPKPAPEPLKATAKPGPVAVEPPAPPKESQEPKEAKEPQEKIPAESTRLFLELPVAVTVDANLVPRSESKFATALAPVLPARSGEAAGAGLEPAGQVVFEPSGRVLDCGPGQIELRAEVREFVRSAPVAVFELRVAGEAGLIETSEEPMDLLIFPHPPQASPPLWQEVEQNFAFEADLGALARAAFVTTGIEDGAGSAGGQQPAARAVPLAAPQATARPVAPPPPPAPKPQPQAQVEHPPAAPAFARPTFPKPAAKPAPDIAVPEQPALEQKTEAAPAAATKPMPVTLHGLAAGRGKPVQVFGSAVGADVDLQIPRSTAVPMRPVMIVAAAGTKAEEKPVPIKNEPKRPQPVRPDPRFSNGKARKPEVRISEPQPEKREEKIAAAAVKERAPEPVVERKPAVEAPRGEARQEVPVKKPVPAVEPPKPTQLSARYTAPDLGLPNLMLQPSGGFLSRMPLALKAAIGLLVVAGIVAIAMLGKGKGTSPSAGQVVEAGTPLPAIESGWITDWGAEPGVRKVHEISVLRPSLTLSDYRIEFEAQIDTKALGWVYRAVDGKNYYVNRLEIVKPGLNPTVALVRFAVINGEEQPRSQFPLSMPLHLDTLYKIRFDAVGDRFTTYVQNQKVDEWTDGRLKVGGVGLYSERGERMSLKGTVNVVPLAIRK